MRPILHLIPHTHWDREWYLPLGAHRARLVGMLDDVLDRLAADPRYRTFLLDGQAALLADYLTVRPDRAAEVEQMVRAGRLQTGPWYVLADEQIPAGESLIRNLLLGGSMARRLGGSAGGGWMRVLYSPDAFGHPAVLPALSHEFGIAHGVVWRGIGSQAGGRDLFWWAAPDARRILVYHLPPAGYEVGADLPADPARLRGAWDRVRETLFARASTRHVAVFVGADHHRAHADLVELQASLAAAERGCEVRISTLLEFLSAAASEVGELTEISGELRDSYGYTWTLQGVHATRAPLKRRNAALELVLSRHAEPLVALGAWAGGPAEGTAAAILRQAWRDLVECHFHDAICGTCHDDVIRALDVRLTDVESAAAEVQRDALHRLVGHDPDRARAHPGSQSPALIVWNPSARARGGVVTGELTFFRQDIPVGPPGPHRVRTGRGFRRFALRGPGGERIPIQVLDVQPGLERIDAARHYPDLDLVDVVLVALETPRLAGMGNAILEPLPASHATPRGDARAIRDRLRNGTLEAALLNNGTIALHDRRTGLEFPRLMAVESGVDLGDTYSYCPPARDRLSRPQRRSPWRVVARGPLLAAATLRQELLAGPGSPRSRGRVEVATTLELRSGEPFFRLTLQVNNQAPNHRLRIRFPTGAPGVAALAGSQFGTVRRAPGAVLSAEVLARKPGPPIETPVLTAPAHRFVAVTERMRGLAVLAPGFFEYELTPKGELLVTLLRAVGELSRSDLATRPGHAAWPAVTPLAQCLGASRIELALAPITEADSSDPARLERMWENAFVGIASRWIRDYAPPSEADPARLPSGESRVELQGEGLVFSAMKPAEGGAGIVLRCYNSSDQETAGVWRFGRPVTAAFVARADESPLHAALLEDSGTVVRFRAAPFQLVTLLIH
jgi:alpha-mannosidase